MVASILIILSIFIFWVFFADGKLGPIGYAIFQIFIGGIAAIYFVNLFTYYIPYIPKYHRFTLLSLSIVCGMLLTGVNQSFTHWLSRVSGFVEFYPILFLTLSSLIALAAFKVGGLRKAEVW